MEEKINIAEILKNKPKGTKLYSPLFGDVSLSYVQDGIINLMHHGGTTKFFKNGKYYAYLESEPLLFPSESMRDWSKFAWKKGDVLVSNDGCIEVIFDRWYDDTYTSFYCKHYLDSEDENDIGYLKESICLTRKYSLEDTESFLCYVNTIEEKLGSKLNLETLEIEKQPEKKQIVDLKPKWTPKPFDKIVAFEELSEEWVCDMFSHYSKNYEDKEIIVAIGGCTYFKALPFNEETAKLIGTSDDWER